MGQAKREWEEALARGFHNIGDKFVCEGCFGDDAIKDVIRQKSEAKHCDYCGRNSEDSDACVAAIDTVMAVIVEGIEQEWAEPTADGVSWISREGGWQSPVYDTWELFRSYIKDELEIDGSDLLDDIIESVGDKQWCQRDHLLLPPGQAMIYGWERFSYAVKYETRYMFFEWSEGDVSYGNPDEIPPSEMLRRIGKSLEETGLLKTIPEGSRFFRARPHKEHEIYTTARDLGPPPCERALSNRMSPAGIPMFYGAGDAETAIAETGGIVTVGAFDTVKALTVLDLYNVPPFPSLFDRSRRHLRGLHLFLRDFVTDLSRPIVKDGREHIEYVPTQIITEYFRHQFRAADGQRIHGILYPSARREGGRCCVLFCSQENCTEKADDSWKETDQWLRLDVKSTTRRKTKRD
jgi:hypothetical protein